MHLPRNGSLPANALLVACGAVLGSGITWILHWSGVVDSSGFVGRHSPSAGESSRPAPDAALVLGAGGSTPGVRPDIRAAISIARAMGDSQAKARALRDAGAAAARGDVAEALRIGADIESDQEELDFHRGLFGAWAESDPLAALQHARANFPPGLLQTEAISIGINKWGGENPREAWIWAEQNLSGPLKEQALSDLMIGWTRRSPDVAANWLANTGYTSQPLFSAVARTWAEEAPEEAAAWAESIADDVLQETVEVSVASEWARQDPEEAAAHFEAEVEADTGVDLATAITQIWGTTDPLATAEWIATLDAGPGRNEAASVLATVWAATDIGNAVQWASTLPDPSMREQVITHIGTTWGAIEPGKALDWLATLPPSEAFGGVQGAFDSWAATDPIGLRGYIDQSPSDASTDLARRSLADVLTDSDVSAAMDLALGMAGSDARSDALGRYYRHWRKLDEPSAQEWVSANAVRLDQTARDRLAREAQARIIPRTPGT